MIKILEKLDWSQSHIGELGSMGWSKEGLDDKNSTTYYQIRVIHTQPTLVEATVNLRVEESTRKVFHAQWGLSTTQKPHLIAWTINRVRQPLDDDKVLEMFKSFVLNAKSLGFCPNPPLVLSDVATRLSTLRSKSLLPLGVWPKPKY